MCEDAGTFFASHVGAPGGLATSAEVLQELLHAYLPVGRLGMLEAAFTLVESCVGQVWSVEAEDVRLARLLADRHPALGARDLLHVACCRRREVDAVKTYDRALATAFATRGGG